MAELKGSKTAKNLMAAFAGESQARNRYTMGAKVAKKEGYVAVARVFEETADNERAHASREFKFLAEAMETGETVGIEGAFPVVEQDTRSHLVAAIAGEKDEATDMYPTMSKEAEEEGFHEIAIAFREIGEVEAHHQERFQKLLDDLDNDTMFKADHEVYWKCLNCGYIHYGKEAPKKCPACAHPQGYFEQVGEYQ
jgi:rubrerythrin